MTLTVPILMGLLAAGAEPVRLSVTDEGKTIETRIGGVLLLTLPFNGGTGYLWQREPPFLETIAVREEAVRPSSKRPGAPQERMFRITARGAGRVPVKFALRRPWEKTARPAGEFRFTLLIRP